MDESGTESRLLKHSPSDPVSILRRMPARLQSSNGDGAVKWDQTSDHASRPDGYLDSFDRTWLTYVGRSLEDLQGWKWTAFIHPHDVEEIDVEESVENCRASQASGEPFLHEARVLRADGEYRRMLHHKAAMRDGCGHTVRWHGTHIDVEDRKRTEEQLKRSAFTTRTSPGVRLGGL
jgi:PAS domain S-box-containing protein